MRDRPNKKEVNPLSKGIQGALISTATRDPTDYNDTSYLREISQV
jgi:hypothetical protein